MVKSLKILCLSLLTGPLLAEVQVKPLKGDEKIENAKVVVQKEKKFDVLEIEATVGQPIIFHNADTVIHNVFSISKDHMFNLGKSAPDSKIEVIFDKPGDVDIFCAIHPKMMLKVKVKNPSNVVPKH